jgi:hypothetical protein
VQNLGVAFNDLPLKVNKENSLGGMQVDGPISLLTLAYGSLHPQPLSNFILQQRIFFFQPNPINLAKILIKIGENQDDGKAHQKTDLKEQAVNMRLRQRERIEKITGKGRPQAGYPEESLRTPQQHKYDERSGTHPDNH